MSDDVFGLIDLQFTAIFTLEMVLKLTSYGPKLFFWDGDFLLIP